MASLKTTSQLDSSIYNQLKDVKIHHANSMVELQSMIIAAFLVLPENEQKALLLIGKQARALFEADIPYTKETGFQQPKFTEFRITSDENKT